MARGVILLLLVPTLALGTWPVCELGETSWVGQSDGKALQCCVEDSRDDGVNDSRTVLTARCRFGKHKRRVIIVPPDGGGRFARPGRLGKLIPPICAVTVPPTTSGPLVGTIDCPKRLRTFVLTQ